MISYERQNEILELLKERRTVTVEFLCRRLFASGATVRRIWRKWRKKACWNGFEGEPH